MKSYGAYLKHVLTCAPVPRSERISVEAAAGRVLLEDIRATIDDPVEARSAMDGYAVHARDLRDAGSDTPVWLAESGRSQAGRTPHLRLAAGTAWRIMTGAPMPAGADAVVPVEHVTRIDGRVQFVAAPKRGAYVRRPRENFRRGTLLIRAGTVIRAQELGLAITAGYKTLRVARPLRVGVVSTGDELVPPGSRLRRGEVFDSNRPTILAMARDAGVQAIDLGRVGDRPEFLDRILKEHRRELDMLVTIGGVSAGDFDVVKVFLRRYRSVDLVKVGMRPAKPQAFGRLGRLWWYGLPGNPVSAMIAFDRFVRPFVMRATGHRLVFRARRTGVCETSVGKKHALREFIRAHARQAGDRWHVRPVGPGGSSNIRSMVNANALIILPERCRRVAAGEEVAFELLADPPLRTVP